MMVYPQDIYKPFNLNSIMKEEKKYFTGIIYFSIIFLFVIGLFNIYFIVKIEKDYNEKYSS